MAWRWRVVSSFHGVRRRRTTPQDSNPRNAALPTCVSCSVTAVSTPCRSDRVGKIRRHLSRPGYVDSAEVDMCARCEQFIQFRSLVPHRWPACNVELTVHVSVGVRSAGNSTSAPRRGRNDIALTLRDRSIPVICVPAPARTRVAQNALLARSQADERFHPAAVRSTCPPLPAFVSRQDSDMGHHLPRERIGPSHSLSEETTLEGAVRCLNTAISSGCPW